MKRLTLAIFLLALTLMTGGFSRSTVAQSDESVTSLIAMNLDQGMVPIAPAYIRLVRITLDPGASSPLHTHPGPELWYVETGPITVFLQGPALFAPGGDTTQLQQAPQNSEFQVADGDTVAVIAGTALSFRNDGTDPVALIAIVIVPTGENASAATTYPAAAPSSEAFAGITPTFLGDGAATAMPAGPVTITLDRLSLANSIPLPGSEYPTMYTVETGELAVSIDGGSAQISRTGTPGPQPDAPAGTVTSLSKGDALFFPNGLREAGRTSAFADVSVYRLQITATDNAPLGGGAVADIRITGPAAPVGSATKIPSPEPTTDAAAPIAEGSTVYVIEDEVNLRDAPSLDSNVIEVVGLGAEFIVVGPAETANEITWWPVQDVNNPDFTGYIAEQYLSTEAPA